LGFLYRFGDGVTEDKGHAAELFLAAADQGNRKAQYALGDMYLNGELGDVDKAKGATYFKQSADNGHMGAQTKMGELYADGVGVKRDIAQSIRYYTLGALNGDTDAQFALSKFYYDGKVVKRDDLKAVKWGEVALLSGELDGVKEHVQDMTDTIGSKIVDAGKAQAETCYNSNYEDCNEDPSTEVASAELKAPEKETGSFKERLQKNAKKISQANGK